jgi:hypothetical protein
MGIQARNGGGIGSPFIRICASRAMVFSETEINSEPIVNSTLMPWG